MRWRAFMRSVARSSRHAGIWATKLIWLALRNITATWERAAPTWRQAMNQFAILYGDRFLPPTT